MTAHYGNKVIAISKLSCYVIGADNYSQILFHNVGKLDFAVSEIVWNGIVEFNVPLDTV